MRRLKVATPVVFVAVLGVVALRHANSKHHSVTLTWHAVSSNSEYVVSGYNLYRSSVSGSDYIRVASRVSGSRYEDRQVRAGKTYFYVVTAVDDKGRESPYSIETRVKVPWW